MQAGGFFGGTQDKEYIIDSYPFLRERDDVFRVRLRIMVRDKNRGGFQVVDRGVIELCATTNIWRGLVFPPQTVLSNKHPTQKHVPLSSDVGTGVVDRVLGVDGEVDSLTELGHGVPVDFLESKNPVETMSDDLVDTVLGCAVK